MAGVGFSDGDKGDITISSSGTVLTIDNDAVTYAKIQNVSATDRLLGRSSAGAGDVEEITCTSFGRSLIDDADAATARTTLSVQPTASPAFTGTATVENLTLSGSARRIVADFSNADFASRAMFQSSASNASTVVAGVPSGTGSTCVFRAFGASDVTNANFMTIGMFSGTDASIRAEYRGTASAIPLTFHTGGTTQLTISSTGTATFAGQIVGQAGAAISGAATFENSGNVVPLTVTNAGTANSFVVNDASGDSDPFVIDAAGRIAIGATAAFSDAHKFAILGGLPSSAGVTAGFVLRVLVPSSSTNNFISCLSNIGTEAASYTVNSLEHYAAAQQSLGAGSAIGSQYGFVARDSLTGATNNFGFWSNIASGTGRWNFYANGTAQNYFGGQVLVTAGSKTTCSVAPTGDPDTGMFFPLANTLALSTGDVERVRVDASGNVGIGVTPTQRLHVVRSGTGIAARFTDNSTQTLDIGVTASAGVYYDNPNSGYHEWQIGGSGKMRLTGGAELLIGTTTDNGAYLLQVNSQIYATNATIATSDARFKTNVESLTDATSVIESLRPVAFDFIPQSDRNFAAERQVGLIAQEAQAALAGTDYADSVVAQCGDHLGLAYEKLVPVLIKALQESNARIAALEERLSHG
jgi:hypothetical protein